MKHFSAKSRNAKVQYKRSANARAEARRTPIRHVRYRNRITLLSRGEAAFFHPLAAAVAGRYLIMCKVRLADIITCSEAAWRRGHGAAIAQKHIDFVLCDHSLTRFALAIELDDRSHALPHRRKRDRFIDRALTAAGVTLLRFRARRDYDVDLIRRLIDAAVSQVRLANDRTGCSIRQSRLRAQISNRIAFDNGAPRIPDRSGR